VIGDLKAGIATIPAAAPRSSPNAPSSGCRGARPGRWTDPRSQTRGVAHATYNQLVRHLCHADSISPDCEIHHSHCANDLPSDTSPARRSPASARTRSGHRYSCRSMKPVVTKHSSPDPNLLEHRKRNLVKIRITVIDRHGRKRLESVGTSRSEARTAAGLRSAP